jgi:hypothetical protein
MANILSMVLTMTVALFGFALRMVGSSREVAWPFFIASIILMLLWRPRLDYRHKDPPNSKLLCSGLPDNWKLPKRTSPVSAFIRHWPVCSLD